MPPLGPLKNLWIRLRRVAGSRSRRRDLHGHRVVPGTPSRCVMKGGQVSQGLLTQRATLSLLFAALALFPFLGRINPANIAEVQGVWNREIAGRGVLVRASSVLFVAAIAAAAIAAIWVTLEPSTQSEVTTFQVNGTGASEALATTVTLSSLPAGATIVITIQGVESDGTKATLLTDNTAADSTGSATVSGAIPNVSSFQQFSVISTVNSNGKVIRTERASLTP